MSEQEPTATELAEAEALARALESLDASSAGAGAEHAQALAAAPADALEVAALLRMTQPRAALMPEAGEAMLAELQSAAPQPVVHSNLRRLVRWSGVLSAAAAAVLAVLQLHPFASAPTPSKAPVAAPAPPPAAVAPHQDEPASAPEPSPAAPAAPPAAEERARSGRVDLAAPKRRQAASAPLPQAAAAPKQKTADEARKKSEPAEREEPLDDLLGGYNREPPREQAAPAAPAPLPQETEVASDVLHAPVAAEMDAVQERSAPARRPRRDLRLAAPSWRLAEAEARLARAARGSSPQVDAALRAHRADVLQALIASDPGYEDALRDMISVHAAVEHDLERADYAAARARLTRALSQARSELARLESRVCERDLLGRLAQVVAEQGDARAALRYADQGLALGARSDAFDVALLLQRARALAWLGDSKASEVGYAEAAALADKLSRPR